MANGTEINNYCERQLQGLGDDYAPIGMTVQAADVSATPGSVHRVPQAGNTVVFDEDGSYIEHKRTGNLTPIASK